MKRVYLHLATFISIGVTRLQQETWFLHRIGYILREKEVSKHIFYVHFQKIVCSDRNPNLYWTHAYSLNSFYVLLDQIKNTDTSL